MMKKKVPALAALMFLLLLLPSCFDVLTQPGRENPADPMNPDTDSRVPPRPSGLGGVVSDRMVVLTWSVSDTTSVDHYRVYRWEVEEEDEEDYELLYEPEETVYTDGAVSNGQEYRYRVSSVNGFGLEGERSAEHSVVPRLFSVAIEQGRPKTGSREVSLTMSVSGSAQLMRLSNAPDMAGAAWIPYQGTYLWELTQGDGEKTVYVSFRDFEDNESDIVSDSIVLDTQASILGFTEDTGGAIQYAGDVIHFVLDAGEPYGEATADLGSADSGIVLRDDGTAGDQTADDGVYERDYVVPPGMEVADATVVGHFTDEVGNEADDAFAAGTVTIHDPPAAPAMDTPTPLSERRIALSWSRSIDADFTAYRLYRSYVPGVGTSGQRELVFEGQSPSQTDFTDGGLEPDSTYYYAVYAVDDIGLSAISNEVAATTLANAPPDPVEMYAPWAPDSTSLILSWSQSDEDDFSQYEVIGWEQDPPDPPDTSTRRVIARIDSPDETFYTHESLVGSLVYWYRVAVVDSFGARAVSDSVSGTPRM